VERRYSSYSFSTSAIDGGEWSASCPGRALARRKDPGTHCTGGWADPRAGLDTEARGKILWTLPGIEPRSPGRPARRQTLYRLSYPEVFNLYIRIILMRDGTMSQTLGLGHTSNVQLLSVSPVYRSRGSSVSIVSGYGMDDRAIEVRSPAGAKDFSSNLLSPDRLWGPPSLLYNGYRGSFPQG
jgi:hypothetical protein